MATVLSSLLRRAPGDQLCCLIHLCGPRTILDKGEKEEERGGEGTQHMCLLEGKSRESPFPSQHRGARRGLGAGKEHIPRVKLS